MEETTNVVADQQVNTISLKMQGNEAYMTISHTTDGGNADTINTESNLAYEMVNTGCEVNNVEMIEWLITYLYSILHDVN